MKNITIKGYTIDTFFVVATIACLSLSCVLGGKVWDCLLGAIVIATLGVIDLIIQFVEKVEDSK